MQVGRWKWGALLLGRAGAWQPSLGQPGRQARHGRVLVWQARRTRDWMATHWWLDLGWWRVYLIRRNGERSLPHAEAKGSDFRPKPGRVQ